VKATERLTDGERRLARFCLQRKLLSPKEFRPILAERLSCERRSLLELIEDAALFNEHQLGVLGQIDSLLHGSSGQNGRGNGNSNGNGTGNRSGNRNGNVNGKGAATLMRPILDWQAEPPAAPGRSSSQAAFGLLLALAGCALCVQLLLGIWNAGAPDDLAALQRADAADLPARTAEQMPSSSQLRAKSKLQAELVRTRAVFDKAVAQAPGTPQPYLERGQFLARMGDWKGAVADYSRALEQDAKYGPALLARALAWEVLEKITEAAADLNRAKKLPEVQSTAEAFMARLLNQAGNHEDALGLVGKTIARDPQALGALVERGKARFHLRKFDAAERDFGAVIKRRPSHQVALVYLGRLALARGDSKQAEIYFSRARKSVPRSPQLAMIVADFYASWGKLGEARRWYEQTRKLGGPPAALANRLGLLAMREGRYWQARKHFSQAIAIDPQRVAYYNNRGNAHYVLSQWDRAIRDLHKSLSLDDNQDEVHYALANAYGRSGQMTRAFHQFNKAIEFNGENARAHCYRATILYYKGKHAKAIEGFEDALAIRPDYRMAKLYRAICEIALDNSERAIQLLGDLVSEAPNRPEYHHYLGNAYMGLESWKKATQSFTRALRRNPASVESLVNRAAAYDTRGLIELALKDLLRVRQLTPNRTGLQATIDGLELKLEQRR